MDSIFFSSKRVHWTAVKFQRGLLEGHPLTPARFDVLFLLTTEARTWTQSIVRNSLGIARATASEMLGALEELGFVVRSLARRGATRIVTLTELGREVFERAYEACVGSGRVTFAVEEALSNGNVDDDVFMRRAEHEWTMTLVRRWLGDKAMRELHEWNPEFLEGMCVEIGSGDMPDWGPVPWLDVDRIPIEDLEPVLALPENWS